MKLYFDGNYQPDNGLPDRPIEALIRGHCLEKDGQTLKVTWQIE